MVQNTITQRSDITGEGGAPARLASVRGRLGEFGDRLEIATHDGVRLLKDRTAMAAGAGRAQVEQAQDLVSFHARRRPLLVTAMAATSGVLLGLLLLRAGVRAGGSVRRARGDRLAA